MPKAMPVWLFLVSPQWRLALHYDWLQSLKAKLDEIHRRLTDKEYLLAYILKIYNQIPINIKSVFRNQNTYSFIKSVANVFSKAYLVPFIFLCESFWNT